MKTNKLEQSEKTKKFIKDVEHLINTGVVKTYKEIIDAIGWDKTTFSNVLNGRKDVPSYIYSKFNDVYQQIQIDDAEKISVEHLIRIDSKCDVILSVLAEVLAKQQGHAVGKISADFVKMVNDRVKERIQKL